MPNFPKTIPAQFAASESLSEAYSRGWNEGHGLACHNVPSLGSKVWTESEGQMIVGPENVREVHSILCHEAESHSRCFSPFELTASEFNESEESESLWEAYECGVADSIAADLETYTDSDYGLTES